MGWFSRTPKASAAPPEATGFHAQLADLRVELHALQRELKDVEEYFEARLGRRSKRQALEAAAVEPADGSTAVARPPGMRGALTPTARMQLLGRGKAG